MTISKPTTVYPALICLVLLGLSSVALAESAMTTTRDYKKQYTFTQNTFTDRIPTWTQTLKELAGRPNTSYLEIGTFEGRSALWTLENIQTHPTSKLTVIDAFVEHTYDRFVSNIKLSGEPDKFRILTGLSTDKIREVPFDSIDLAYVDGSGKGIIMLSDVVSTWSLVKVGGIIIVSRWALDARLRRMLHLRPDEPGPQEAIDAFLRLYKPYINVLVYQVNQVIVRKTRE
jgi:predicted O-methyltransferase YrrM